MENGIKFPGESILHSVDAVKILTEKRCKFCVNYIECSLFGKIAKNTTIMQNYKDWIGASGYIKCDNFLEAKNGKYN